MKIVDGLKLVGAPAEIPGCGRSDLPAFFVEMGFKVGAEIGVDRGYFSLELCRAGLKLYGIDPWLNYSDYNDLGQRHLDYRYREASKRVANYDCALIRKTSMEAIKDFADDSLDFVYIDGHHGFKYITEDIYEWSKKVRPGGVISGHDYIFTPKGPYHPYACHVKFVLPAYTRAFKIDNWYLLGKRYDKNRDRHRSWLWINPKRE